MTEGSSHPQAELRESARPASWLERSGVSETDLGRQLQARLEAMEAPSYEFRPVDANEIVEASDLEVYRELMSAILDELKHSDVVRAARGKVKGEGYEALTDIERSALLDAFDRARRKAFERVEMSEEQRRRLQHAATSELNYSLRHYIREGTPEDWMVLDPKARPVDFMNTTEVLRYLKNSGTPSQDVHFLTEDPSVPEETKQAVAEREFDAAA